MSSDKTGKRNERLTAYQWKPGESGNPKGRAKNGASIAREIDSLLADGVKGENIQKALARVVVQKALAGDHRFYTMVMDWTDGKVPDKVETDSHIEVVVRYEVPHEDGDPDSSETSQRSTEGL